MRLTLANPASDSPTSNVNSQCLLACTQTFSLSALSPNILITHFYKTPTRHTIEKLRTMRKLHQQGRGCFLPTHHVATTGTGAACQWGTCLGPTTDTRLKAYAFGGGSGRDSCRVTGVESMSFKPASFPPENHIPRGLLSCSIVLGKLLLHIGPHSKYFKAF